MRARDAAETPGSEAKIKEIQMTRMTPSEAFVETMVANNVTTAFGIMGSAFMDAMDIFAPAGIRLVPVVHEQGAAHMADGFARVSGRHGVVIGQNGPGISNCVTAIAAAYWAHSPVVIVTPETGTMGIGLGGFQEANQLPMFQEFTKYQGHINNENRMAEITARCFDRAHARDGPRPSSTFPATASTATSTSRSPSRWCSIVDAGGEQSLNDAAELLANAEFPVMVSGGGVVMGGAVAEAVELAERLGCPVVNSYLHNDSFPASHPQWCGPLGYQGSKAAMKLIAQGRRGSCPRHPTRPVRHSCPSTTWTTGQRTPRSSRSTPTRRCSASSRRSRIGICGDAGAAATALTRASSPTATLPATRPATHVRPQQRRRKLRGRHELDEWTHEKDDFSDRDDRRGH